MHPMLWPMHVYTLWVSVFVAPWMQAVQDGLSFHRHCPAGSNSRRSHWSRSCQSRRDPELAQPTSSETTARSTPPRGPRSVRVVPKG